MKLVDRLRERADAHYGSHHEELRRVLDMAIERIEAADAVDGALPVAVGHHMVIHAHRDLAERLLAYRALADKQDGGE